MVTSLHFFPALCVNHVWLLWVLIGPLDSLCSLWLARVNYVGFGFTTRLKIALGQDWLIEYNMRLWIMLRRTVVLIEKCCCLFYPVVSPKTRTSPITSLHSQLLSDLRRTWILSGKLNDRDWTLIWCARLLLLVLLSSVFSDEAREL